ncbi:alpha/beta fold hydrolase [Mycobacterium simiae]|uniref:alpha/beta fold hydrolase n=1 Tax=Mycobacterium simiae TaxID=1784 RepID=UPI0020CB6652|nr:hypothetical protein [Mycobacterium simiae]
MARGYRATSRLAQITAPLRILFGTQSPAYFRAGATAVAELVPGATVAALRGQGHQAVDYDPRQFARAVLDFDLSSTSPHR